MGRVLLTVVLHRGRAPAPCTSRISGTCPSADPSVSVRGDGRRAGASGDPHPGVVARGDPGTAGRLLPILGDDWPTTTLPAFEVAWCAAQQSEAAFLDLDLRIRRAFFAEGRNIGRREVLLELAQAVGLDVDRMAAELNSGLPREAV